MNKEELDELYKKLKEKSLTIAFAESMTAGLLVNEFSKVRGASEVLKGGIVVYHPELKIQLLDVDPITISKFTPESREVTTEMVKGLVKKISADIAIAVTGLATSGGSETPEKPVGTVFISFLIKNKLFEFKEIFECEDEEDKNDGTGEEIMYKTVDFVFKKIKDLYQY